MFHWVSGRHRWLLASATLLIALGFLFTGHFLVGVDSPPPLINSVGYWLDADEGQAYWLAASDELDQRQTDLLAGAISRPYRELLSVAPQIQVLTSAAPMIDLDGPRLEVLSDSLVSDRRQARVGITNSMNERLLIIIPDGPSLLGFCGPDGEWTELPSNYAGGWWLRLEGMPVESIEITFEFSGTGSIQGSLLEERTGLPVIPGLAIEPSPGTMKSPGVFTQSLPNDFTAISRSFVIDALE